MEEHDASAENVIINPDKMWQGGVQNNPRPFFPQCQCTLLLLKAELARDVNSLSDYLLTKMPTG